MGRKLLLIHGLCYMLVSGNTYHLQLSLFSAVVLRAYSWGCCFSILRWCAMAGWDQPHYLRRYLFPLPHTVFFFVGFVKFLKGGPVTQQCNRGRDGSGVLMILSTTPRNKPFNTNVKGEIRNLSDPVQRQVVQLELVSKIDESFRFHGVFDKLPLPSRFEPVGRFHLGRLLFINFQNMTVLNSLIQVDLPLRLRDVGSWKRITLSCLSLAARARRLALEEAIAELYREPCRLG